MIRCRTGGIILLCLFTLVAFHSELAMAQFAGGDLESKVNGITHGLISFILPAASILGLVYAAILAATGDAAAKSKMVAIAVASLVGMLAPLIVGWLQRLVS